MEEAFLWLEIKIMELGNFEDVVDCTTVVLEVSASGNANVIHINADCCSKGFMLEDDVPVNVVHHGLERRWRVGKSEVHDCGFEKSISGFKSRFLFISLADLYIVIAPLDVKL